MAIPITTNVYGRVIPNTSKNIVSQKILKPIGIKYPINEDTLNGYFSKQSGLDLIRNNLKILLKTIRGERFMLPEYGCNLKNYLMEPLDETTFNLVKEDIQTSIRKYLDGVNILKLQVVGTESNTMNVNLVCSLREDDLIKFETRIVI
jgi:phage baseplate assembly protein W